MHIMQMTGLFADISWQHCLYGDNGLGKFGSFANVIPFRLVCDTFVILCNLAVPCSFAFNLYFLMGNAILYMDQYMTE